MNHTTTTIKNLFQRNGISSNAHQPPLKMKQIQQHSGGISRATRRICVISVALAEYPAALKCPFRGYRRGSRSAIQREYCNFCHNCSNNSNICNILSIWRFITDINLPAYLTRYIALHEYFEPRTVD